MTRSEILFNYRQAVRQAEKLENLANRLKKLSQNKMRDTVGQLQGSWQSDHSNQYLSKVHRVSEEIAATAGKVMDIANAVRTTAEAVKNAELRALEIAKNRSYR